MSEGKQLVSFASKADLPEIKKLIDVPLSMANFTDTAQVGTDVNFVEPEQGTALFAACKLGHIDVVSELLVHPRVDVDKPVDGVTPLEVAVTSQQAEMVALLLAAGAKKYLDQYKAKKVEGKAKQLEEATPASEEPQEKEKEKASKKKPEKER